MKNVILILSLLIPLGITAEDFELKFSTFAGGGARDFGETVTEDEYGNIYILGHTESSNFPVTNDAFQTAYRGGGDLFLMKFDENHNLLWSTLIGGSSAEYPKNLKYFKDKLYVVSDTRSSNFPTTNDSYQKGHKGDYDGTIMKFSLDGKLLYSTMLGSNNYDVVDDIVIDEDENYWVTGRCYGTNFPVTNDAMQKTRKTGVDSFISKFDKDNNLIYSTYIGGNDDDFTMDLAINRFSKTIAVVGYTSSNDFPLVGTPISYEKKGGYDTFLSFFNYEGEMIWSSYFGDEGNEYGEHIVSDNEDGFYFRQFTNSKKTKRTYNKFMEENPGSYSSYLGRVNFEGELDWGTYYGGSGTDSQNNTINKGGDIAVDENSNVLITGFTESSDLFTTDKAYKKQLEGATDAYIAVFDKRGIIIQSSYFGGQYGEDGRGVYISDDKLIITGSTESQDYPVTDDAIQKNKSSGKDGFISVFALDVDPCNPQYSSENGFKEEDLISNKYLGNSSVLLTKKWAYDSGYMYYNQMLNLISGFETEFSFIISDPSRYFYNPVDKAPVVQGDTSLPGADGIALILTGEIPVNPALAGGDIGYGGLKNAIAIEIDLYENPENRDPNGNHLSVILPNEDGEIYPLHPKKDSTTTTDIVVIKSDSSQTYHFKVEYKNLDLKIYISETKDYGQPDLVLEDFPLFEYFDLQYSGNGFIGLTSSTGRSVEVHEITEWSICTSKSLLLTSVDDVEVSKLDFYPSPVYDNFVVSLPTTINNGCSVKVYDLLGNNVINQVISSYQESVAIDASQLSKGAYSIVIESESRVVGTSKFIKK